MYKERLNRPVYEDFHQNNRAIISCCDISFYCFYFYPPKIPLKNKHYFYYATIWLIFIGRVCDVKIGEKGPVLWSAQRRVRLDGILLLFLASKNIFKKQALRLLCSLLITFEICSRRICLKMLTRKY